MPSKGPHYIPQGNHDFLDWNLNFVQGASENAAAWDLILADIAAIKAKSDDFAQKMEKSLGGDASKADIRAKNTAHHETQTMFRDFVKEKSSLTTKLMTMGAPHCGFMCRCVLFRSNPAQAAYIAYSIL
ncbi:hypothetical protein ACYULU_08605 [Breznakiellaceae bacterium SP9]